MNLHGTWPKIAIVVSVVCLSVAVFLLLGLRRQHEPQLSLAFQRYSDFDLYEGDVAFLSLTNASSQPYLLSMTGATNSYIHALAFGRLTESVMVNCEFSDRTQDGRTNRIQQPFLVGGALLTLAAHSGLTIRVPLPPSGQRRTVAVLCRKQEPSNSGPARARKPGILALLYWRQRLVVNKLFYANTPTLKVWCNQELTNQWERAGEQ